MDTFDARQMTLDANTLTKEMAQLAAKMESFINYRDKHHQTIVELLGSKDGGKDFDLFDLRSFNLQSARLFRLIQAL